MIVSAMLLLNVVHPGRMLADTDEDHKMLPKGDEWNEMGSYVHMKP